MSEVAADAATVVSESAPEPTSPQKKPSLTTYLVLGKDAARDIWVPVKTYDARSAREAIFAAAKEQKTETGTYVAVPARSWQPLTVKTETQTKLVLS